MNIPRAALLIGTICLSLGAARADDLKRRGFVGIETAPVEKDVNAGAKITYTWPGGFAASNGMKVGDIIVSVNGKKVNAPNTFVTAIRTLRTGDKASLQYQR